MTLTCWVWGKGFSAKPTLETGEADCKVMDHDHITGEFRGIAHNSCNLKMMVSTKKTKIPVVFHNLREYDSHLVISALGTSDYKYLKEPSCIPINMEKYMSFTVGPLKFIDLYRFLSDSLDASASFLQDPQLTITRSFLNNLYRDEVPTEKADELFKLMRRKGVYPYSYVNSLDRFDEECLPPIEEFYNELTTEHISDTEYRHAHSVWNAFNRKNFSHYHDLYLKTDVLQLADVFENFRNTALRDYKLDPPYYISLPGYSWAAMLRMTDHELGLITDMDTHMKIDRGIRGGISTIGTKRYAKANNKYCPDYDPTREENFLMNIDANSLYSTAMTMPLPMEEPKPIEEIPPLEMVLDEVVAITLHVDDEVGRIYEVDISYPKELHDHHNDYPLVPENIAPAPEDYSEYIKKLRDKLNRKIESTHVKLTPNVMNKSKYMVYGMNLQLYLILGN